MAPRHGDTPRTKPSSAVKSLHLSLWSGSYKLKEKVLVCELWLSSCIEEVCETTLSHDASFVVGWPTTNVVATFRLISEAKEREGTKATTALQVLLHNNNVIKLIKVNNKHTAKDCIRTLIEHTENNNADPSQYQLWVKIGKEESPYPLIGHEYPYCIKMNYLRNLFPHKDLDLPFDDVTADIKCNFTLRRNYQKVTFVCNVKASAVKPKKPLRMLWPFRRQKQDSVDSGHGSPPPTPPCKLFGQPLKRICPNGVIAQPIMNIFKVLFYKGPYTVGIFRKSANARCCRELKLSLETQSNVNLKEVPVLVMASVLKLHAQCACRLLHKLPVENLSLLRHLMCLLCRIHDTSDENKMTAPNLAVCIGPSILSITTACPQEMSLQVPQVVNFLIGHCSSLFGQDCIHLLGPDGTPDKTNRHQDSGAEESDAAGGYPRDDDSSIDSLEREYIEPSSKYPFESKMSLTNLSRDSGLTLSDTQLYAPEDEVDSPAGDALRSRMTSLTLTKSAPHLEVVGLDGQRNISIDGACPDVVRKRRQEAKKSPPPPSSNMAGSPCEESPPHYPLNYSVSYNYGVAAASPDQVPTYSAKQSICFGRPVNHKSGLNTRQEEMSAVLRRSASEESLLMSRFGDNETGHPRKRRAPSPPRGPSGMIWRSTSQLPTATPDRHALWFARQNRGAPDWKRSQSITKIDESTTTTSTLSLAECSDESTPHVSRSNSRVQEHGPHRKCSSASSSSSSTSSEGRKPPPTYQEAINRKTLLHRLHTSPVVTDEMRQHQTRISAKARQLYENSLRQYHEQADAETHRAVLVSVDSGKPILHRTTSETPSRLRHLPPVHVSDAQLPRKTLPALRALRDEHTEDWRKEISWSVAQLRTIFTPQEQTPHTSPFKAKVNHHKRSDSVDSQTSAEESFV
ncbi:ARHGAP20 [Cordylochernes scorpioides]|uniref:ARHGAP20 n=1 Tax=Cordylochernes scorpioides TaxID=51811 RepID=A0ABY6KHE9_9ARAC|nr:ARHGAP20 [Cordylochernes scorpioides]